MTEPIAIVRNYKEMMDALRERAKHLGMTRMDIDDKARLQDGYAGKLFAPVPIKSMGSKTLGPVLQALGLMIVVVEDAKSLEQITCAKLDTDANAAMLTVKPLHRRGFWRGNKEWGRVMRARATLLTSGPRRSSIARMAARVRWSKRQKAK